MNWPEKAERLAEHFPVASLHGGACRWFEQTERIPVGIACSGGADSLCLLLLLWAHYPERRNDFEVLHFDHRLRGEESRADARFVEEVVAALGLKARFGAWERPAGEAVSEETAREARFAFFRGVGVAGSEPAGKVLFLGHQQDDIVENVLMRLSRGSGCGGLAAPRPVQRFRDGRVHLRPLLSVAGADIRRALNDLEIPFRVDASNARAGFYRNRIRLEVLPLWQNQSPFDVAAGAAASRELLEEDDDALWGWLRELIPEPVPGWPHDLGPLAGKPAALWRRGLHEWLGSERLAGHFSKQAFDRLLKAAVERKACKMSGGDAVFVEMTAAGRLRKIVRTESRPPLGGAVWPLPAGTTMILPGGRSLAASVRPLDPETRDRVSAGRVNSRTEAVLAWEGESLSVRHWRAGDRFRPLGAPGSRKLQDMFVDLKVPEGERTRVPVVCVGDQILWAPFFPPAEAFKISSLTKMVVQLTYGWGEAV